ncbi:MAG: DNA-binding protein WhiA [Eubacteriaceae bacterium]|nr:DNA-binding protein WhiA [Eubacteriaceae bacterium]
MSFSTNIKQQLCRLPFEAQGCMRAELAGMLAAAAVITKERAVISFCLTTESPAVAGRLHHLTRLMYSTGLNVQIDKNKYFGKKRLYHVICDDDSLARQILKDARILKQQDDGPDLYALQVPPYFLSRQRYIKHYMRGVFLAAGSASNPQKNYHIEMVGRHDAFLKNIGDILSEYDIRTIIGERKGTAVLHIKESASVVTFLGFIGAHKALLEIENVRIMKDMRNGVNRQVNCDVANLQKTTDAAYSQLDHIQKIKNKCGLDHLSPGLRQIAELRMLNPDVSIKELGELMVPPIGKSAAYHRLEKIKKIAQDC